MADNVKDGLVYINGVKAVISDDFDYSEGVLFLRAGGTSGITEGEAILVFDKEDMSCLNDITYTRINFNEITTQQMNTTNDQAEITATLGFYHDRLGFSALSTSNTRSTTIRENTTTSITSVFIWGDDYNINTSETVAIKIKVKPTSEGLFGVGTMQVGFNINLNRIQLILDVTPTDCYYYIDLDGGSSDYGDVLSGGIIRQKYSKGWVAPEKEGYDFSGFMHGDEFHTGLPPLPTNSDFTTDIHLKAVWVKLYTEIKRVIGEGCSYYSVSLISGSYYNGKTEWFTPGSVIDIRAYPKSNYRFTQWDNGDTSNPRRIIMDKDYEVQAFFEKSGSNVYVGNQLFDVYLGNRLMDVYVGTTLI